MYIVLCFFDVYIFPGKHTWKKMSFCRFLIIFCSFWLTRISSQAGLLNAFAVALGHSGDVRDPGNARYDVLRPAGGPPTTCDGGCLAWVDKEVSKKSEKSWFSNIFKDLCEVTRDPVGPSVYLYSWVTTCLVITNHFDCLEWLHHWSYTSW